MLLIQRCIIKYAGLEQVVAEVRPLTQVTINIRQWTPKSLQYHLSILFPYDLVSDSACWINWLLADGFDLWEDLSRLNLKYAFKHLGRVVDQVRQSLFKFTFWRHIDSLYDQFTRINTSSSTFDFGNHFIYLLVRKEGQRPHELDHKTIFVAFF